MIIYTLSDPDTNEIRYIGKTVQNLKYRLSSHISQSKTDSKKDHCHCWIKSLLNNNKKPVINVLDESDDCNDEAFYINYFSYLGCNLTNHIKSSQENRVGYKLKISKSSKLRSLLSKKRELYYIYDRFSLTNLTSYKTLKKCLLKFKITSSKKKEGVWICGNILITKNENNENLFKYRKQYYIIIDSYGNVQKKFKTPIECSNWLNVSKTTVFESIDNNSIINYQYKVIRALKDVIPFNTNKNNNEILYDNIIFKSQKDFANYLNVSTSYLSQILNNKLKYDLPKFIDSRY